MQTAIELAPAESAHLSGGETSTRQTSTRPDRLRLLPSTDAAALPGSFDPLRNDAALVLLPLASIQSLAARIRRLQPDVVIIAVRSVSAEPWQRDSALRNALLTTPAMLLAPSVSGSARQLAAELGIASVLPQELNSRQLIAAIHAVAAGLAVRLPSPSENAAEPAHGIEKRLRDMPLVEQLTPRERAVLDRMAHGCGNKQIAAQLEISEHTAKFHVSSILAKLGASSRTEAVTLGILNGLVAI